MKLFHSLKFYSVEKITIIYILLTSFIIMFVFHDIKEPCLLLINRLVVLGVIVLLAYITELKKIWVIQFVRYAFLGGMLAYWYPETFEINRAFNNLDYLLAYFEQQLFGSQPALLFSEYYPQRWLSEAFNMAYWAYYPIIVGTSTFFFITNRKYFSYFFFSVLFSFLVFYIVFILFPTAGPQYYFPAIGWENVSKGIFPNVGKYFDTNQLLIQNKCAGGFFYHLVENSQQVGERPTAAFPSSHVGITVLIMIMVHKSKNKVLFYGLLPLALLLIGATVYIQAHYVIDVIAGLLIAIVFFHLSGFVYRRLVRSTPDL